MSIAGNGNALGMAGLLGKLGMGMTARRASVWLAMALVASVIAILAATPIAQGQVGLHPVPPTKDFFRIKTRYVVKSIGEVIQFDLVRPCRAVTARDMYGDNVWVPPLRIEWGSYFYDINPIFPKVTSDVDLNDLPTASLGGISAVYTDASGQVQTLTAGQLTFLESALTLTAAPGNTDNGSKTLTYSLANNALGFVGPGQTVVLTANVTVDDHHGGTASTPVSVTIGGVENSPIVPTIPTVTANGNSSPFTINLLSTASDVDPNVVPSLVAGSLNITASDGYVVTDTLSGSLLTIDPSQFQYLGAGQTDTLNCSFDVTDGNVPVLDTDAIVIADLNDAPVGITSATGGTVAEDPANGTVVGTLHAVDPDQNDTAAWTLLNSDNGVFALSSAGQVTATTGVMLDHWSNPAG
jgi:hypothetical protein